MKSVSHERKRETDLFRLHRVGVANRSCQTPLLLNDVEENLPHGDEPGRKQDTPQSEPERTHTYHRGSYACCLCGDARGLLGIPESLCATGSAGEGLVSGGDHLDLCAGEAGRAQDITTGQGS